MQFDVQTNAAKDAVVALALELEESARILSAVWIAVEDTAQALQRLAPPPQDYLNSWHRLSLALSDL